MLLKSPNLATTALLVLAGALVAFLITDRELAFLEDETSIVSAARTPPLETIRRLAQGQTQHEHPPLSDVLLHFWLPVAGSVPRLLRLPSILLYLGGVLVYALTARKMAGDSAFRATLWIGCLWPFGFHFGRLVGWYSFCFFLLAILTWAYMRYLERPDLGRWVAVLLAATLLLYTNYYGWAIVACLVTDVWFRGEGVRPVRFTVLTLSILALLYLPVWRSLFDEVRAANILGVGLPFVSATLNDMYNLYCLFVSESIAPWFWWLSLPTSLAIVTSVGLLFVLVPKQNLRFFFYFTFLFAGMAVAGIIGTKRLLFISGWLLLPVALAIAAPHRNARRRTLVVSLALIGAIGWLGFALKKYYASGHFIEPWPEIADQAANAVKDGGVVVSNSPSFLFYMNYSLQRLGLIDSTLPGYVDHPRVLGIDRWKENMPSSASAVLFVKAVNKDAAAETRAAEDWFKSHCMPVSTVQLVPDSGYSLKSRLFPDAGQMPFRISIEKYSCEAPRS